MEEKHGGIWITVEQDDNGKIIFEKYLTENNKLHVIYLRKTNGYTPFSFVQKTDYQYRLPIWSKENEKAIIPTLELAKEYLLKYT